MKKSTLAIIIGVVAVLIIGGLVYGAGRDDDGSTQTTATTDTTTGTAQDTPSQTNQTGSETGTQPAPAASASAVTISDFSFGPSSLTVKKGTTVTWTNQDSTRHDVTPDAETAEFKASQLLAKGESYSVTFNTAGSYSYFCSPHPYMKATIQVVE